MRERIRTDIKQECAGCGTCGASCPQKCIKFVKDELGFTVPVIDDSSCIHCGICLKVCPQQNKRVFSQAKSSAYFCQSYNNSELAQSSSGGAFSVLSRWILSKGGKVWGVSVDVDGNTEFVCIDNVNDLWKIRGSKYVEVSSPLNHTLIKSQLDNGELIMVCGLPCQIRGMKNYLGGRTYKNLLLVDLLCYGIQSPIMWKLYLNQVNPQRKQIKNVFMRDKRFSWYDYSMKIEYFDGTHYEKLRWYDDWLLSYSRSVFNRESCSCCQSKIFPRSSDFTIGDFWGIINYSPKHMHVKAKKGLSLIYAHSQAAWQIMQEIKDEMSIEEIDEESVADMERGHSNSVPMHSCREDFVKTAISESFAIARKEYLEGGLLFRFKKRVPFYKKEIKSIVKKVMNR